MQLQTKQGGASVPAEQQTKMAMSKTAQQQRPPAGRLEVMPANDGDLDEEDGDEEAEVDEDEEEDEEALVVEEFDDPVIEDNLWVRAHAAVGIGAAFKTIEYSAS